MLYRLECVCWWGLRGGGGVSWTGEGGHTLLLLLSRAGGRSTESNFYLLTRAVLWRSVGVGGQSKLKRMAEGRDWGEMGDGGEGDLCNWGRGIGGEGIN